MIEGVITTPLKQIPDDRGIVMHMLRRDSKNFSKFGEIYFSTVYPDKVKGWHLHKKMTLNYAVIFGEIKLVLYDARPKSKTKGKVQEFFLSPKNHKLVSVPPLIQNGFKGIGDATAIVANCSDLPYDDTEIEHKSPSDSTIPYDWNKNLGNKSFD